MINTFYFQDTFSYILNRSLRSTVTCCDVRALQSLVASSTNSSGMWLCKLVSLSSSVVIFLKIVCLDETEAHIYVRPM
jgi:hypothetical protein